MSWITAMLYTKCLLMLCQRQNIDHDAVWCVSCCELEIFHPLGDQKQTTYSFVPLRQYARLGSHIVTFINPVWLTVGSDKSLKEGNFLNCNIKKSGVKAEKEGQMFKIKFWFKRWNWGEWLMLTELKAPSCGPE